MKKITDLCAFVIILITPLISTLAEDDLRKTRLPESINSFQPAIMPICDFDEKVLYFDRKFHFENTGNTSDLDDIWQSKSLGTNAWDTPKRIAPPINTKESDVLLYLSPDGKTALISGTYSSKSKSNNSYSFIFKQSNGGWSFPAPLKIENYSNDSSIYSATLSYDLQTIILSLAKPNNSGGMDLYASHFNPNTKTWSEPKPLGKAINSKFNEVSPFLAFDNKTLFFASDKPNGLGGYDLYLSTRLDDSWDNWSAPVNLGKSINTPKDDNNFWLTAFGNQAYYVSYDNVSKRQGIYKIDLPTDFQPKKYAFITGSVYELQQNKKYPVEQEFEIKCTHISSGKSRIFRTIPNDAEYIIPVIEEGDYKLEVMNTDFAGSSSIANIYKLGEPKAINADIYVQKFYKAICPEKPKSIKPETEITAEKLTLYYAFDEIALNNEDSAQLNDFIKNNACKKCTYTIKTYADNAGSAEYNQALTDQRAASIKKLLIKMGISSRIIKVQSFGKSKADNPDQSKNRRLEIIISK